ncbi:MAG TPA: YbaN family protein [Candidatus Egerieimonas intestinavium]|uniref:YbaN family protein n=1 Tax=Candidatus Egerieimonas intestinavium TaxID=2840777 RepID=A0A9D1JF72_9FIRM|nr:YbaN family protein [Candidatus Egerieimonas intestinavium]
MKRVIYLVLGCVGLGLGALGAALPLLPAFPFLLLAAVCFGKSSPRLHNWFIGTKLYKNNLESFVRGQGMTIKAKFRIMSVVTLTMAVGFLMMSRVPLGQIILLCVWVAHIFIFLFAIKTRQEDSQETIDLAKPREPENEV